MCWIEPGSPLKTNIAHYLKDPSYDVPFSLIFLQENRTTAVKMEALECPGCITSTICLEDNQAADSLFPPNEQRPLSCNAIIKTCLQLCSAGCDGAGSPSEPEPCELHHLRHVPPELNKHWCTYEQGQACSSRAHSVTASQSSLSVLCFSNSNWVATTAERVLPHFCVLKSWMALGHMGRGVLWGSDLEGVSPFPKQTPRTRQMKEDGHCEPTLLCSFPSKLHSGRCWAHPVGPNAICNVHVLSN